MELSFHFLYNTFKELPVFQTARVLKRRETRGPPFPYHQMSEKITTRKQQAIQTRKKILNCALDLFEKKGYDNVTMQEIAEASGTSVGSIYRYFKNKEEIAAQNAEPLDDIYHAYFEKLMSDEQYRDFSAAKKLDLFYLFIQDVVSGYENLRSLYIYDLKYPRDKTFLTDYSREIYRDYQLLLDACRKEGTIRSDLTDEMCFDILLQSSRGMLLDWLLRNKNFDFHAQAQKWWHIIFSYMQTNI